MMNKTKIMYLIDYWDGPTGGGTERQLIDLMDGLEKTKYQAVLAVFRGSVYLDNPDASHLPVYVLGITKLVSARALVSLLKLSLFLRREKIKIVHIFLNDAAIVAPFFCRLGGAKVVAGRRDMGFWYNRINLAALAISNWFVDRIIANSEAVRANVAQREHYPADRIEVIYNGQDLKRFDREAAYSLKRDLGIPGDAPVIGIVANLYPVKRHADLIEAFKRVVLVYPAAQLFIVGSGKCEADLRALVAAKGLDRSVQFIGVIADVVPVIRLFSVGVLCSESEGFANALVEYMACGVPVVATRTGGNTEIVEQAVNGFLVDVGDTKQIAESILAILSDASLASRLSHQALVTSRRFDRVSMTDRHVEFYDRLLGNFPERRQESQYPSASSGQPASFWRSNVPGNSLSLCLKTSTVRIMAVNPIPRTVNRLVFPQSVSILMYHSIVPEPPRMADWCLLDACSFRAQMSYVKRHFDVLHLTEATVRLAEGSLRRPALVITFDDGYQNNHDVAYPVLRELGLPSTIFLNTSFVGSDDTPWFGRLQIAIEHTSRSSLLWRDRTYDLNSITTREKTSALLQSQLKQLPYPELMHELTEIVHCLSGRGGMAEPVEKGSPYRMLSPAAIEAMGSSGLVRFGAHTARHCILSRLSPEAQEREIADSIAAVSAVTRQPCTTFAYPNGRAVDYDRDSVALLRRYGIVAAVTTVNGPNTAATPVHELRRYGIGAGISFSSFKLSVHHVQYMISRARAAPLPG